MSLEPPDLGADLPWHAITHSDLPFTVSDPRLPDDPLVWVNAAFTRLTGYSAQDALGRNCRFLQGPGTDRGAARGLLGELQAGRTGAAVLLNYRRDGTPFWNQVVASPVRDADGRITHHVGIQADVSDRVHAERERDTQLALAQATTARLDLLARVSDELATHLDYAEAVRALADVAVPALATWGYVVVTDERGRVEHLHVTTGDDERRAAARALQTLDTGWLSRSPRMQEALHSPPGFMPTPYAIDVTGLPARTTPEQLDVLQRLGLGSALVVPLRARDRVIGALALVHESLDAFGAEAVVTAAHLGRRAGLALDNVRLFLAEREAAITLQHSLLPEIPPLAGLDVAATYVPSARQAEIGGDWFDVLRVRDGSIGLAVGDVVGHDLRAAATMGQLRSLLRAAAWDGEGPARVLARVDEVVRGLDIAGIATCVFARWEPDGDGARLTYARAGHPPGMLRLPHGEVLLLEGALRTPLGIADPVGRTADEAELQVRVPAGATLVLYTDGLVERRDRGLREGVAVLAERLAGVPAGADAKAVRDELVAALAGSHQEDDVCLLVVRPAG
ncbi:SpoIIE family protein phosphatase [Cellulomonas massiliensis]|uniref:SpoIIE family protein phosphatase n=1 Tax=Cellulomonas massiliensis TaxID=1465811 RepID=UPI0002E8306F|nr:SpoIIE family protein phosphatase [Cellulomonas massiliensis]